LINGTQACNVYFIVGSAATLGASMKLRGIILACSLISLDSAARNEGI
jgi:hypothetical protein